VWLFLGVSILAFSALNLPFVLAAGPANWIKQVFVFPVFYFDSVSANNLHGTWPQFRGAPNILKWLCFPFMHIGLPLIYAGFLKMRRKLNTNPDEPWDRLLLTAIIGVAMLAVMIPAVSIRRVSCVSPPAMICLRGS
jgi:hypothetical protein